MGVHDAAEGQAPNPKGLVRTWTGIGLIVDENPSQEEAKSLPIGTHIFYQERFVRVRVVRSSVMWKTFLSEKPKVGIYIGTRTLWNGKRIWDSNKSGFIFQPESHLEAALIVTHPRKKPFFVPLSTIQMEVIDGTDL